MANKKIFGVSQTTVDLTTGEVVEAKMTSTYINRDSESFGMYTTTNGLEWAKPIRAYLLMLMVLNEYSDKDGYITLSTRRRNDIGVFFEFTNANSLKTAMKRLIEYKAMKRVSANSYMLNPEMFYKGSTTGKSDRIIKYNAIV